MRYISHVYISCREVEPSFKLYCSRNSEHFLGILSAIENKHQSIEDFDLREYVSQMNVDCIAMSPAHAEKLITNVIIIVSQHVHPIFWIFLQYS